MRQAAVDCIEELHQQLGATVLEQLEALSVQPERLESLQARLAQLSSKSQLLPDYPLFQAVTAEGGVKGTGSVTSKSDCSSQVIITAVACYTVAAVAS